MRDLPRRDDAPQLVNAAAGSLTHSPRLRPALEPTLVNEPAHDNGANSRLSAEGIAQLRDALKQWVDGDAGSSDSALRDALQSVAREARDRGIHAEELLVALKTTWFEIGGAPNGPHAPHASSSNTRGLDELVTACIKAYYN